MDKLYIPGDLVTWLGRKVRIDGVIVDPNTKQIDYYEIADTGSESVFQGEDLNPIKLTRTILKKNGWKSINGKYALKIKNANYVVLEFTEDGIYVYINEKTILFTIKYIHELQHLLFGLGLNSEMEV
jgi:hypothetical protein